MNPEFLSAFLCPRCNKGRLSESSVDSGRVVGKSADGMLSCDRCDASFPIVGDLARFVGNEGYAKSFGYQWELHGKTQLDSYTGQPISRRRLFDVTGWSENLTGQMILEAGCGAGRFTEVLISTGAEIFSFDYSSAVDVNYANNGTHSSLCAFQADILHLPIREESFDKVLCLGVLQHTPDPSAAFQCIARRVRQGGELVVDVYANRLRSLLHWKYILRPITRRMRKEDLYRITSAAVNALLPISMWLRCVAGRAGARLMPIVEYSHLGIPAELNKQWATLDTFDMYSPAHDHPQSIGTVRRWFDQAGYYDITVSYGPNGIVGKGRRK